jgi:hypothetical protein
MRIPLAVLVSAVLVLTPFARAEDGSIQQQKHACKQKVEQLIVPSRPCRGTHWVHGSARRSAKGILWTTNEAATLYWQLGAGGSAARFLSGKVPGESGGRPWAHGPPDGKGLIQVEVQFHPEVRHLNLYRPKQNGIAGIHVLRKQGRNAWYAPSSAPGRIRPALTR